MSRQAKLGSWAWWRTKEAAVVERILVDGRLAWRMRCFPLIGMVPPVYYWMPSCVRCDPGLADRSQTIAVDSTLEAVPLKVQYFRQKLKRVGKARTNKNDERRVLFADA